MGAGKKFMVKFGFFGGSFNPPTYAHLKIAEKSLKLYGLDKVFFVPVGNYYSKPGLLDELHRYNMIKIMCEDESNIEVEDIELNMDKKITTIEAFRKINDKYKNSENYFIMGADNFKLLPTWKEADEILANYNLIVFSRGEINLKSERKNVNMVSLSEYENCSSGIVRNLIENNKLDDIIKYTKCGVLKYIKENNLYFEVENR